MEKVLLGCNSNNSSFNRPTWQKSHFINFSKDKESAKNSIIQERDKIFNFFIKRYAFYEAYKYIENFHKLYGSIGTIFLHKWSLIIILIFLFLFIFWFKTLSVFFLILGFIGILLSVLLPFYFLSLNTVKSFISSSENIYPSIINFNVSAPKMTVSILTGWLVLFPFFRRIMGMEYYVYFS